MHKISLDLTKTVNGTDVPLTLVAAMRNAIERGFTMADLVFNLTERGYDMVLVPKGMKNGMLVPLSPNELVQQIQKHQAGTHDQQSHGNWADKLSGTRTGGNRLELYDSLELQKGQPDSQQTAVYKAQADAFSYNDIPRPFFNNNRGEYGSTKEYDDAYKKYSKEFTAWQRATTKNIESPLGKEYLNGTPAGVKKYVKEVITQDWFVESFGKGLFFPNLEIIVNDASVKTSASYFRQYNTLSEASRHGIRVYRGFTQDERLLLHEIAHYATAISATEPHQPHGREWAGNYLYILQNTMGEKTVDTLRKEFDKKGVKYTND